ncbi:AAA family ATPase [Methanohalobium sp.]|uniref:AAA family ATPase n=1 Tax=Methanohalobium sp. TaxID=2837493 RepID=UPI0025CE2E1D|nr:AAA family ATPase [Methanohalobium sp.]
MNSDNEILWVEKYRPKTIEECILPKRLKDTFQQFVNQDKIPNLLLTGSSGVGKTTVAQAMLNETDSDYMMINGSNEGRLIDTLRVPITNYASAMSLNGNRKYVIMDEADYINPNTVQPALRNFIEEFSQNCGFILTCNFENRIIDALHSRCSVIRFDMNKKDKQQMAQQFFKRCQKILKAEGIDYDQKVLADLIMRHMPDWRRVLNELQRYSAIGKIDESILVNNGESNFQELLGYMKEKHFNEVRKWVAHNFDNDFEVLCRSFYDKAVKHMKNESVPQMVLILAEYQYKHSFCADPEINCMAMLTEIMMTVEWK